MIKDINETKIFKELDEVKENKKLSFTIKSLDTISFKTAYPCTDDLTLEEAENALFQLSEAISWCLKWKENINIWEDFLENTIKDLDYKSNIIDNEYPKKYNVTISLYDFYNCSPETMSTQLRNELYLNLLKDDTEFDVHCDYEIITLSSDNREKIETIIKWFYETKVLPLLNKIKELK